MSNNPTYFEYSASLEDKIKTVNLTWTIKDFKRTLENRDKQEFRINNKNYTDDTQGVVKFGLLIETISRGNDVLEICYYPSSVPIYIKSTLFTVANRRHTSILATKNYQWEYSTSSWLPIVCINKKALAPFIHQDKLTLEFQFSFNDTGEYDDDINLKLKHISTLKNDLNAMLTSSTLYDVKIRSSEGVELDAHKNILTARCAVLKAHFEHGTKESISNVIESSFDMEVLRAVLQYIYSDKLPEDDNILKILPAADFYQLEGLKHYCEHVLIKKLTVENVIEVLQLADLHSAKILRMSSLRFIKGRIVEVTKTDAYKDLQLADLIKSIHEYTLDENAK